MDSNTKQRKPNHRLRHERELRGWTQHYVAEQLGADMNIVSRWERGERLPSPYYRQKLCALFGKNAKELGLIDQEVSSEVTDPPQEVNISVQGTFGSSHTIPSLSTYSGFVPISSPTININGALPYENREPTHEEDWSEAPRMEQLYGRDKELVELKQWTLDDHCRIVAILGMGGIGKTSLAVAFVERMKDEFTYIFWRSLHNAPPLKSILQDCIKFLSDQQQIDLPEDKDSQISLLIEYLQKHRCLLVLDNFETVFQRGKDAGHYLDGYEVYGSLLQRLGEAKHQSCFLLTSREKPKEIAFLEGENSPVRSRQLNGLGLSDGQAILKDKRLYGVAETWEKLIEHYAGNPLTLKLVSQFIREVFSGDIAGFLSEGDMLLSDVRDVLDQQFERLSTLEQEIMYWLAIEREAKPLKDIQDNMVNQVSKRALQDALRSLRRRNMIEIGDAGFTLQNVVMEYVTDRFIDTACQEVITEVLTLFESHALMKAQAKDYVRESQVRLILTPIAQQLLSALGNEGLERKCKKLLAARRQASPPQSGYAAGNMLNLLIQLGFDLRSYDFSQLAVRQAYLQGVALTDVNFAHANLSTSVFTSTYGNIFSVAFSPNGELLATGASDGGVWVWHVPSGTPLLICRGHTDWVRSVTFSPDGHVLASTGDDLTIRLWEVITGRCFKVLQGHSNWVRSLAFSPDGKMLVSGSDDQTIRLWDLNSDQCLYILHEHAAKVKSLALSPDGKMLVSGSIDQTVRLWEISTGQCLKILKGFDSWVWCVAFSPHGNTIASGSDDQSVRLWEVSTGRCLTTLRGHTNRIWSVAFSPDGKILASGSEDQTIRLWDISAERCLATLQGHTNMIWSIAFSPDGSMLASGGDDQSLRLWEVSSGHCLTTLRGYAHWTNTVAFNSDGDILASGGDDKDVRLWEVSTGQCLATLQGHTNRIRAVAFSPNKTILASAGDDQHICFWEVNTGQPLTTLQGHTNWINSIAFSPDGSILASGGEDWTARLWEVNTGDCLATLQGHTGRIRSVAFSPNGKVLVSGSEDRTIRLWEVSTGRCLTTLQGQAHTVWSVAFSPDGSILASGEDNHSIRLWEVSTGRCLTTLQGQAHTVWSVAFSPDGKVLAGSGTDRTMQLWDVNTGQCLITIETPSVARSVVFSPDGKTLASANSDGTTRLWKIRTGTCLKTLRSDRPYERMNITGIGGITEAQRAALKALGAIEVQER